MEISTDLNQVKRTDDLWVVWTANPAPGQQEFLRAIQHVNTTTFTYINNQGQHVTITDAELYLTFLTERAVT